MRLHTLTVTGVGPFLRTQEIDFDELSESGLFLIDGPTGSGKTTIIDAIVYALFGDVSGGGDSDASRIRSSYCSDADPTGVVLEFSVDGRRHRISRVPAGARDPEDAGRAATSKPARQVLTEFAPDGQEKVVLTKVADIRAHIEALLTLTADQFRHLVVLPQGKFADLLRMTPTDRLTELASLLDHREFFARVQEDLKREGVRVEDQRRRARDEVATAAQQLSGRLTAHLPDGDGAFTDAGIPDDERLAAVDAVMDALGRDAEAAARAREACGVEFASADARATAARAIATALAEVGAAQERRAEARARLHPDDTGLSDTALVARLAELHAQAGSLGGLAAWEDEASVRAADRRQVSDRQAAARDEADLCQQQRQSLPQERIDIEAALRAAQALAATRAAAADAAKRARDLVATATAHAAAARELERLAQTADRAEHTLAEARAKVLRAEQRWVTLMTEQRAQQAAALAATLEAGSACPVCGSTQHPSPAHPPTGIDLISDPQIDSAQSALDQAKTEAAAAETDASTHRSARDRAAQTVAGLAGALGSASLGQLQAAAEEADAAHDDAVAAEASVPELDAQLAAISERDQRLADQIATAREHAAQAAGQLAMMEEAEEKERARIAALVGAAGTARALLATVLDRIDRIETAIGADADLTAAAGAVPADQRQTPVEDARMRATSLEEERATAAAALAAAESAATTLSSAVAEGQPLARAFTDAVARRRAVDQETAAAAQLALLATGRNPRSLPLRSYALQRRFESVLAAATVHLDRMSSGKFSFELNEETTRGQAGLGIALHDSWTGHRQDPKSLSGGETFYAALSLALGLADVVRGEAGGSALETLFIDEGFGSLDQDSLYQVLDQLDHLRAGRRAIGVISHVTEMKESISDRIEVRRGPDSTSTVTRAD